MGNKGLFVVILYCTSDNVSGMNNSRFYKSTGIIIDEILSINPVKFCICISESKGMESGQVSVGDTTCTDQQRPEKKLSGHTICW